MYFTAGHFDPDNGRKTFFKVVGGEIFGGFGGFGLGQVIFDDVILDDLGEGGSEAGKVCSPS